MLRREAIHGEVILFNRHIGTLHYKGLVFFFNQCMMQKIYLRVIIHRRADASGSINKGICSEPFPGVCAKGVESGVLYFNKCVGPGSFICPIG